MLNESGNFLGRKKLKCQKKKRKSTGINVTGGKHNSSLKNDSDKQEGAEGLSRLMEYNFNIEEKVKNIKYEIESWSSFISTFHPKNILLDNKTAGPVSKWSVDFKSQNEFLFLKLEKTSIVYMITFGKFKDPTNLKEFKIYAGLTKSNLVEILHAGLSMDNEYEPFTVKYKLENTFIPCNYIKIVPIRPWDDNYNISVWFVNLKGVDDEILVNESVRKYNQQVELESMKNWLNLSRRNFYLDCLKLFKVKGFEKSIQKMEDPLITDLYKFLIRGNFEKCESILDKFCTNGYFNAYLDNLPYKVSWKKVDFLEKETDRCIKLMDYCLKLNEKRKSNPQLKEEEKRSEGEEINEEMNEVNSNEMDIESNLSGFSMMDGMNSPSDNFDNIFGKSEENTEVPTIPSARGGHSMVIDDEQSLIYLFGGWDGSQEFNDFWCFEILSESWKLISLNTLNEGGPSKRSCHKMVFDSKNQRILLYGKFSRPGEAEYETNLYEFDTRKWEWRKLSIMRELKNGQLIKSYGPGQVYDHQLAFDSNNQVLYLFGGSKVPEPEEGGNSKYLGLWKLDLKEQCWQNLLNEETDDPYNLKLKTRYGHTMLLGAQDQELIIFGGNKGPRKYNSSFALFDMIIYNIENKTIREVSHDFSKNGPDVNFSLGSFYNRNSNEIYVFAGGYLGEKHETLSSCFWVFNFYTMKWTKSEEIDENIVDYEKINISNNFYHRMLDLNLSLNDKKENDKFLCKKGSNSSLSYCNSNFLNFPAPRYAHKIVFSIKLNKGFIFGGNPNIKNNSMKSARLSDFWSFKLSKQTSAELNAKLLHKLYKLYFEELCGEGMFEKALQVLKDKIPSSSEIKNLPNLLLLMDDKLNFDDSKKYPKRYELFEYITKFVSNPIMSADFLNR